MSDNLVTKTQLAKILGCTPQYIGKLAKPGGILVFRDNKIDKDDAISIINSNRDPSRPSQKKDQLIVSDIQTNDQIKTTDDAEVLLTKNDVNFFSMDINDFTKATNGLDFTTARTEREKMALINGKIDFDIKMKDLVPRSEVERQSYEVTKIFKDSLLVISDRICDQLAAESDPEIIVNILDKELKNCLNELIIKINNMEF